MSESSYSPPLYATPAPAGRVPDGGFSREQIVLWHDQRDAIARHQRNAREHVLDRMTQANLADVATGGDLTEINAAIRGLVQLVGGLIQEKRDQVVPPAVISAPPPRPQLPPPMPQQYATPEQVARIKSLRAQLGITDSSDLPESRLAGSVALSLLAHLEQEVGQRTSGS